MKKYEIFNKACKENKTAEQQSFEMIIDQIEETYGINLNGWEERHKDQIIWLNEEFNTKQERK
ncbi:hypothetical protein C3495_14295 (plasmid) [Clostridiaceae bacterium 14S0207]|nr:hypothetical protein C3495_14295 [Clostridiaceae bacterium 14S0207]